MDEKQNQIHQEEIRLQKLTDVSEKLDETINFLETYCMENIVLQQSKGKHYINIDFSEVSMFSPALAITLLEEPEEGFKIFNTALEKLIENGLKDNKEEFEVRLFNIPKGNEILIGDIRSKHLNKLFYIDATIRQKSDVRPDTTEAKFECPSCGNILNILQVEDKFREPSQCGCGRKGGFKQISSEKIDIQSLILEDVSTHTNIVEVKKMQGLIKGALTNNQDILQVGNRVRCIGIIKEKPIINRAGAKMTKSDIILEIKNAHPVQDRRIKLTPEDISKIKSTATKENVLGYLAEQFAKHIEGNNHIKQALLLQLVSNEDKVQSKTRKGLNIFVFGDWGLGKSQLNYEACEIADKAIHVEVTKSSAVGLTAAVVRDEFLNGWALEAGAVVLAGTGICFIDEIDKSRDDDMDKLGEALEKKTVTISKANIHQTLNAKAKILCAGNILNQAKKIDAKALGINTHILDRFDLTLRAEKPNDDAVVLKILQNYKGEMNTDNTFLRKYIHYILNNHKLKVMQENVVKKIQEYSSKYRGYLEQYNIQSFARFVNSMVRLAESNAKIRLAERVEPRDLKIAVQLLVRSIRDRGYEIIDPDSDEDKNKEEHIFDDRPNKILNYLEKNDSGVKTKELIKEFDEDILELLLKMKRTGEVMELPVGTWRVPN